MTQPPEYDLNETVIKETVVKPAPGAMSPTTRLMLIALGALALAGLAWWLFQRAQPAPVAVTPPPVTNTGTTPPVSTDPNATTPNPVNTGTTPDAAGNTGMGTDGGVTDPNGGTPDPTVVAAVPEGINPDQPLQSPGNVNPFKPNQIQQDPNAAAAAPVAPAGMDNGGNGMGQSMTAPSVSAPPVAPQVTITPPTRSQAEINAALSGSGSTPDTTASAGTTTSGSGTGSGKTRATTSAGRNTAGTTTTTTPDGMKVTTNNGGMSVTFDASGVNVGNGRGTSGTGTANNSGTRGTGSTASAGRGTSTGGSRGTGTAGTGTTTTTRPAAPVRPPVVGVAVPTTVGSTAAPAGVASGTTTTSANAGAATARLPEPTVPEVLASTGGQSADAATATPAPVNADLATLENYISSNQVVLTGIVRGKVDTAVFRTNKGFVIGTIGQAISDTQVQVQSVSKDNSSVTLAVGKETKTLPLNK